MPSLSTTHSSRESRFALVILCIVLVANAVALSAELRVGHVTGNDNVSHLSLLKGMVRAIENGENPLEFLESGGVFWIGADTDLPATGPRSRRAGVLRPG